MTDLTDLLRPLVDRAPHPPPVSELEDRVTRRRRRRRTGAAATAALMVAAVATVAGITDESGHHATKVQVGRSPGTPSQPASVTLPSGYSFDALSATEDGLLISGVVATAGPQQCAYASVNDSPLRIGAVHKADCSDPITTGRTASVVIGSAGMGTENTARIATVDRATGKVSVGPVAFRYLVGSDTGVETAYGGGWMWVYDVDTNNGPEVLQVDTATGRVVDTVPTPAVYRPILAANDSGLWIGVSPESGPRPADTLYRVAPGAHAAVTVVAGNRVVNWLQTDPAHLWAGIATARYMAGGVFTGTLSDEAIWRFNGSVNRPAYAVSLGGADYISVVGDESDWLWTVRWPSSVSPVSPSPEPQEIVRIDPDTGAQTVVTTLPAILEPTGGSEGFAVGQAAVVDGNLYILDPPQSGSPGTSRYVTLTRLAAPTGEASSSLPTPPAASSPGPGPARVTLPTTATAGFDSISAAGGTLLLTGEVGSSGPRSLCDYASLDPQTLQLGRVQTADCDDPATSGQTVGLVTGPDYNSNPGPSATARITTLDHVTGKVAEGPVVFTYLDASDTRPLTAYGGGWMWVYDVETNRGSEVLQVSPATGRVVDDIALPKLYRPILAANDAGLWIGDSLNGSGPGIDTLYRVAPGSRAPVIVIPGRRVITWLQADPGHLWAGVATAPVTKETIWEFDGTESAPAFTAPLDGTDSAVIGDATQGLWTLRWSPSPAAGRAAPEAQQVIRIDPANGSESVIATIAPFPASDTTGLTQGQAAVLDGHLYILEPPYRKGLAYPTLLELSAPRP